MSLYHFIICVVVMCLGYMSCLCAADMVLDNYVSPQHSANVASIVHGSVYEKIGSMDSINLNVLVPNSVEPSMCPRVSNRTKCYCERWVLMLETSIATRTQNWVSFMPIYADIDDVERNLSSTSEVFNGFDRIP